jgi:cyclophilin family peptidyl-prolyl cis-trans isomerase
MAINNSDTNTTPKTWDTAPSMQIDSAKKYTADIETTLGIFKVELLAAESPGAVNNFVFLAKQKFYDGTIFHRIIKTFMIQGGDPTGTGCGGPGYQFADELPVKHSYDVGMVAMANSGPNTNGSQFFVCTGADSKYLDRQPNYTQFGKVVAGMDVVQKIASVSVAYSNGEMSKPQTPPMINSITIIEI